MIRILNYLIVKLETLRDKLRSPNLKNTMTAKQWARSRINRTDSDYTANTNTNKRKYNGL